MSICLRCWDDASFAALMEGVSIAEKYKELVDDRQQSELERAKCKDYSERMEFIAFAGPIQGEGH